MAAANSEHGESVSKFSSAENTDYVLECWAVPANVFRNYVLRSDQMVEEFAKYATKIDENGEKFMTMVSALFARPSYVF